MPWAGIITPASGRNAGNAENGWTNVKLSADGAVSKTGSPHRWKLIRIGARTTRGRIIMRQGGRPRALQKTREAGGVEMEEQSGELRE